MRGAYCVVHEGVMVEGLEMRDGEMESGQV